MQTEHRTHLIGAEKLELPQTTPLLDPAKHLLDAPAGVDRLGVALVAGGAPIDGRTSGCVPWSGVKPEACDLTEISDQAAAASAAVG